MLSCFEQQEPSHVVLGLAGFAIAFRDLLAASASPEQQHTFCKSMLDAWCSAQNCSPASVLQKYNPFRRKGQAALVPADCASTLCLCLMAFGPRRVQQVCPCTLYCNQFSSYISFSQFSEALSDFSEVNEVHMHASG